MTSPRPVPSRGPDFCPWWLALVFGVLIAAARSSLAGPPVIYAINPDTMVINNTKDVHCTTRTITGENLDGPDLKLWVWDPPGRPDPIDPTQPASVLRTAEAERNALCQRLFRRGAGTANQATDQQLMDLLDNLAAATEGDPALLLATVGPNLSPAAAEPMTLPLRPPRQALLNPARELPSTAILRATADTVVADVPMGAVVWVETGDGISEPYLLDASRAQWLRPRRVAPGDWVQLGGVAAGRARGASFVALFDGEHAHVVEGSNQPRCVAWYSDRYLIMSRIPPGVPPGHYQVLVHNGFGGNFGWARLGELTVTAGNETAQASVNVHDYGARGDGRTDDTDALRDALADGRLAPTGGDVFLPPGVYRIASTLAVPRGVRLRGAGAGLSAIVGRAGTPPLLELTSQTGLCRLAVRAAADEADVAAASPAMVRLLPRSQDIVLQECLLGEGDGTGVAGPTRATRGFPIAVAGEGCDGVRISRCRIFGKVHLLNSVATDLVHTRIAADNLDGKALIVTGADACIGMNVVYARPGGILLHPLVRSIIHYNECHFGKIDREPSAAGEDPPLVARQQTLSEATGGTLTTLTDSRQRWRVDSLRHAVVLIVSGCGRGQYRIVEGNSPDTLTVDRPWRQAPDQTSRYLVARMSAATAWLYNYYLDPAETRLTDCVGVVWELETSMRAGQVVLAGGSGDGEFRPFWFNRLDRSRYNWTGIVAEADVTGAAAAAPALFSNILSGCRINTPSPPADGDLSHASLQLTVRGRRAAGGAAIDLTILQGNRLSLAPVGILVADAKVQNTLDRTNIVDVEDEAVRLIDHGTGTRQITPALWPALQHMEWPGHMFWWWDWRQVAAAWPYFPPPPKWPPRWMPVPQTGIGKPVWVSE